MQLNCTRGEHDRAAACFDAAVRVGMRRGRATVQHESVGKMRLLHGHLDGLQTAEKAPDLGRCVG